jgi:DNA transformation protein and related proteins
VRDTSFRDFVLDQLDGLPGVRSRAMFGGHGLYLEEEFFGMIWKGRLFLRTDERSREEYRELGSVPIPFGEDASRNVYWSAPEDVLEDARRLKEWVRAAALVPRKPPRRRPRGAPAPSPRGRRRA